MKIFIDTADLEEIKEAFSWGIVDGVTTNPSLIKKALVGKKVEMEDYLTELLEETNPCPVSLEVDGEFEGKITQEQLLKEAINLYQKFKSFNSSLNIKIPVNSALSGEEDNQFDGLKVIKELSKRKIPVNATLIMSPEQGLLAAKAGARYISPFLGRIDDYVQAGNDNQGIDSGIKLIEEVVEVISDYDFDVEIIAASIRNVQQVRESAKLGVEIATIPFLILKQMIAHPKTFEGVRKFKEDMIPEYKELLNS